LSSRPVVRIEETVSQASSGATIDGVGHHRVSVNGTELHYVSAGVNGSPVLLVHGFPESWWAFHKVIPLLSEHHRVFAVDLRGFGDSSNGEGEYDSTTSANDLTALIAVLGLGRVHLAGQDVSGPTTFRVAATHPEHVRSYTAIETGLPGFGLETLADVTHGGAWHIGVMAASGIPEMLLAGRERRFIAEYAIPAFCSTPGAFNDADIEEFTRVYARAGGFRGAIGLYTSMLREGAEFTRLATSKLEMPTLAVAGFSGDFTPGTMRQVANNVTAASVEGIGHYVAMEAPDQLAEALTTFFRKVDGAD
jgi:pimeloyl-ACP methyl ester carboxylesterase